MELNIAKNIRVITTKVIKAITPATPAEKWVALEAAALKAKEAMHNDLTSLLDNIRKEEREVEESRKVLLAVLSAGASENSETAYAAGKRLVEATNRLAKLRKQLDKKYPNSIR